LIIGNSHAVISAQRLHIPILRASFPQYDHVGGYQRTWIGYRATRQTLFDLANLILTQHAAHEIKPYHAQYSQKQDHLLSEEFTHALDSTPSQDRGLRH
jgi:nitrogenase molybdenum-iron protein NifN